MAASTLDQIVKGAPAPNTTLPAVAAAAAHSGTHLSQKPCRSPLSTTDPTSLLPSSPPQIYLNLLILEASLRSQYLTLRARRRQNTFVLTLLFLWTSFFTYALFFKPREDGKGIGGSIFWLVDMVQKLCFITGVVTALLFWATGQWERGVRWPRRWVGVANRGLRGMNAKIVVIRNGWGQEIIGWLRFLVPFEGGLWGGERGGGSKYCYVCVGDGIRDGAGSIGGGKNLGRISEVGGVDLGSARPRHRIVEDGKEYAEEDIAPGGDYIKLLLLPKPFSPDFREGWEIFRQEYWEKENERRAELRKKVKARRREIARAEGGWLWWTGWRGFKRAKPATTAHHMERSSSSSHHTRHIRTSSTASQHSTRDRKRRPSLLKDRRDDSTHSRSSSRSTTPTPDIDDRLRPTERERRWSTSTTGSNVTATTTRPTRGTTKKSSSSSISSASAQPGTAQSARQAGRGSRPGTPQEGGLPWQSKRASSLRDADTVSDPDDERTASASAGSGRTLRPGPRTRASGASGGSGSGEGFVFPNAPSA